MIQDILYGDVNLRVLKFVEVNDNEDIKKTKSDGRDGEEKEKDIEAEKDKMKETAHEGEAGAEQRKKYL